MNKLAKEVQDILSQLDSNSLQTMSFDQIMAFIQKKDEEVKPFALDFFTFAEEVVSGKKGQSQKTYRSAVKCFKAFVKKETMDISEISSALMRSWEADLQKNYGKNARAVPRWSGMYLSAGQIRLLQMLPERPLKSARNPSAFPLWALQMASFQHWTMTRRMLPSAMVYGRSNVCSSGTRS